MPLTEKEQKELEFALYGYDDCMKKQSHIPPYCFNVAEKTSWMNGFNACIDYEREQTENRNIKAAFDFAANSGAGVVYFDNHAGIDFKLPLGPNEREE